MRLPFSLGSCLRSALVLSVLGLLALGACGYDDGNFDEVAFACNPQRPCPEGRACIGGRCALGDGSGSNTGQLGVRCGGTTCALGTACCNDFFKTYCAPAGTCVGAEAELLCDGKEDCANGRTCCLVGQSDTACGLGDCGGSTNVVCSSDTDCPSSARNCCDIMLMGIKQCLPVSCPL